MTELVTMGSAVEPAEGTPIPATYHFCWFGTSFPYMNRIAIESAVRRCAPARFVLWHSDPLEGQPHFDALRRHEALELRHLDADSLFARAGDVSHGLDIDRLKYVYREVRSHVTRSNIVRAASLLFEGGIYLDIDTLVIRSMDPLRQLEGFLGLEHVLWPYEAKKRLDRYRLLEGPALDLLRKAMTVVPHGDLVYQAASPLYPTAVNGAILGARPGHPFLDLLLRKTSEVPEREWQIKHRLGTHVLQEAAAEYAQQDLSLLPPDYFYPLGPEVSRQYFRRQRDPRAAAARMLSPDTYVVHWYASVSELSRIGPEELRALAKESAFGYLCAPFLD